MARLSIQKVHVGEKDANCYLVACADSGRRNLGKRWDGQRFFHRYGLAPDPARLRWFRLLSDLSPL